jgi:hypothetical protein
VSAQSPLISFEQAAEILPLHHTTFRQRKAGTEELTHVRLGRRVFLVRTEVEALAHKKIKIARAENEHRKALLRLAS